MASWPTKEILMTRFIAGLYPLLVVFSAYAADVKDEPIPETMNVIGITVFFVLFIGMCVGFFAWMWWKNKQDNEGTEK